MLLYGINFFHKTRYGIWKYYFSPSKSIFNRSIPILIRSTIVFQD